MYCFTFQCDWIVSGAVLEIAMGPCDDILYAVVTFFSGKREAAWGKKKICGIPETVE